MGFLATTGNPIGQLSVSVAARKQTKKTNKTKQKSKKGRKDLTSWCTCTGSNVCSCQVG